MIVPTIKNDVGETADSKPAQNEEAAELNSIGELDRLFTYLN
jgi:hypothetical protein